MARIRLYNLQGEASGDRDPLEQEAFEGKDEFSRKLAMARLYIKDSLGLESLTHKELLLLSSYVRKLKEEISQSENGDIDIDKEAAYRWFHHITGYNPYDFKGAQYSYFSSEEKQLIEKLRYKFNHNDDTGSFEKV